MAQDRNPNPPRQDRNPLPTHRELRIAIYVYAALIVIGVIVVVLLSPWIESWEPVASDRAADNFLTLIVFTAIAVPVFMFVIVFGFFNIFYFRNRVFRSRRGAPTEDGPYLIAGLKPQIAWIGLTAAHAIVLFAWGLIFLARADAAPAPGISQLNIDVTGEQWHSKIVNGAKRRGWYLPPTTPLRPGDAYHVDHWRPNSDHVGDVVAVNGDRIETADGGQGRGADVHRNVRVLTSDGDNRTLTLNGVPARLLGVIRATNATA